MLSAQQREAIFADVRIHMIEIANPSSPKAHPISSYPNYDVEALGRFINERVPWISELISSGNLFADVRTALLEKVSECATWGVLFMGDNMESDIQGFLAHPGISGELPDHFEAVIKTVYADDYRAEPNFDALRVRIYEAYLKASFDCQVVDRIRMGSGDAATKREGDWYYPLLKSMYACAEHMYREAIGLPPLVGQTELDRYNKLVRFVSEGEPNPLSALED